jgi:hypothetical protein
MRAGPRRPASPSRTACRRGRRPACREAIVSRSDSFDRPRVPARFVDIDDRRLQRTQPQRRVGRLKVRLQRRGVPPLKSTPTSILTRGRFSKLKKCGIHQLLLHGETVDLLGQFGETGCGEALWSSAAIFRESLLSFFALARESLSSPARGRARTRCRRSHTDPRASTT